MDNGIRWLLIAFVTSSGWYKNCMWKGCYNCCCSSDEELPLRVELKEWQYEVKHVLEQSSLSVLDPNLCQCLLLEKSSVSNDSQDDATNDWFLENNSETSDNDSLMVLKGLPQRPFYKELANRLSLCSRQYNTAVFGETKSNLLSLQEVCTRTPYLVPAETLGMSEFQWHRPSFFPRTPSDFHMWLQEVREDGVMYMLGMRKTMGTILETYLLPPSHEDLLEAANETNKPSSKSKLSVAARARAKHAHRGRYDKFFGTIRGGEEEQNKESLLVIQKLLREAVWINIHTFGGMDGVPVLEVRIESGYGARWKADWFSEAAPTKIQFRGFLEPQTASGYEMKWRH